MTVTSALLSRSSPHLRRLAQSKLSASRVPHSAAVKRRMGGGQPVSRSMEAELWEGHSKEPEGWETTIYVTYGVGAVLIGLALGFAPETSIQAWARSEAQARLELKESGKVEKFEFGTHYNTPEFRFEFDAINPDNPFNEEEDDDDDDDEEEEDEEEDEEAEEDEDADNDEE